MAHTRSNVFDMASICEQGGPAKRPFRSISDYAMRLPRGLAQYAVAASFDRSLNTMPTFPEPRRVLMLFWEMRMHTLNQEIKRGTLYGKRLCLETLSLRDFDELLDRLNGEVGDFQEAVIRESQFEKLSPATQRERSNVAWIKNMTISRDARQLYEESGAIASLSALSDEVQPYRLESFQTLQKNVRDFIIAPFCKYALNNDCRRGVAHLFTAMETSLSICLYVSLIGFIVALPIIPLAVFHSVKLKVTIAILATILNFPLYAFMFHPTTPTLVIICASLAALYVVFISDM